MLGSLGLSIALEQSDALGARRRRLAKGHGLDDKLPSKAAQSPYAKD